MKQGNQFYLDFQIKDEDGNILTDEGVEKIVFYIGNLKKEYKQEDSDAVYDANEKVFKVWLTEEETLEFDGLIDLDCRILFTSGELLGCYKSNEYFNTLLVKESITNETNEENVEGDEE